MKKVAKSHKLPVFGAKSLVEEETDGDDVIYINHQKFAKRTIDDVTAYFADGTTTGVARQHLAAMNPKKHAKHESSTDKIFGRIEGVRYIEPKSKRIKK